jgi:hypothetical protein
MREHFDPIPRGAAVLTKGYLDRSQRGIARSTGTSLSGIAGGIDEGGAGDLVNLVVEPRFVGIITQTPASPTDPKYGWKLQVPAAGGMYVDPEVPFTGTNGTDSTDTVSPAYELSGRADIPIDTLIILFRGFRNGNALQDSPGQEWIFTVASSDGGNAEDINIFAGVVGVRDLDGNPVSVFTGAGDNIHCWLGAPVSWDGPNDTGDGDVVSVPPFVWLTTPYQFAMLGQQGAPFFEPGNTYDAVLLTDDDTGQPETMTLQIDLMDSDGMGGSVPIGTGSTSGWTTITAPLYQSCETRAFVEIVCVSDGTGLYYPQGIYGPS